MQELWGILISCDETNAPSIKRNNSRKKIKFGQQLNECHEKKKKAGEKVQNEIDPPNGPDTQCKNGHQFKYSFFYIKKSLANHVIKIKIPKNVLF